MSSCPILLLSVDHEKAGKSPKLGERAYARSPNFGYSFDFREVLIIRSIYEKTRCCDWLRLCQSRGKHS
jgi:hypothetical protein